MKKIIENNKNLIINITIVLIFSVIITISYSNASSLNYDIIWLFHTSQKISNGYMMYTEINTVLTPIFFWIGALFIKIFGNKILSMYIFSGIIGGTIVATLYNIVKKVSKKNSNVLFLICTIFFFRYIYTLGLPNYNALAIMWWLFAVFLELKNVEINDNKKKNKNNILIGILIGLTIFTKQNIGIFAGLSSFLCTIIKRAFDKNEKSIKEILLKFFGVCSIGVLMLSYFIISGSLYSFMDYCIGGIFEFGDKNLKFKIPLIYLFVIFLTVLGIVVSIKNKDKKMGVLALTQLCLIPMIYPISNAYHISLSLILLLPLLLNLIEYIKNDRISELFVILFLFLVIFLPLSSTNREYSNFEELFMGVNLFASEITIIAKFVAFVLYANMIVFEKENLSKYIYSGSLAFLLIFQIVTNVMVYKDLELPKDLYVYDGILHSQDVIEYIDDVVNYIKEKEINGKKVILVSADASYYFAPLGKNNYIYDFPLYGSLGFEGEERLINNLPNDENVIILKNKHMMYQESKKLHQYIVEKYKKTDQIRDLEVFEKNK